MRRAILRRRSGVLLRPGNRLPTLARALVETERPSSALVEPGTPDRSSVRATIAAHLRDRGEASTADLCALGTTRQYLSILKRQGVIRRVRHGVFALPLNWQAFPRELYNYPM